MQASLSTSVSAPAPLVRGVFAAMTLPRTSDGVLDLDTFERHIAFVHQAGVAGFALMGATGEYCSSSIDELRDVLLRARSAVGANVPLLAGVGAAGIQQVVQRVQAAQDAGADGLLLPMPHFFPYQQQDLETFVAAIADSASLPILIYNLPKFTTPIEPRTTLGLIQRYPAIVGTKDSSGLLDTVRLLKAQAPGSNLVIGNDSALCHALAQQLCDGVVSGVACVLPELVLAFYRAAEQDAGSAESLRLKAALDAFIEWLGCFPVPWGLKIVAQERGLGEATFPMPLSPERELKRKEFLQWFRASHAMLCVEPVTSSSR